MTLKAVRMHGVRKAYRFFQLHDVSLELAAGQIMGFVGPNGAGKSTTMRILMGMVQADAGEIEVLGRRIPLEQVAAKRDIGFVSDDMRLFQNATIGWHMRFVASIYPRWDAQYAGELLKRFNLHAEQRVKGLSTGEHIKAALLLVLARRPRLLILDEPTSGLDPVARHEVLGELMEVVGDEERAVLFSSHNTVDVERICDCITFIDRGRVVESSDKERFLECWRRVQLRMAPDAPLPRSEDIVDATRDGQIVSITTNRFTPELMGCLTEAGATTLDVQRMSLEEIFVANVMRHRGELSR
ncbi:MAG: ABC transporter ATP-binding protein [Xanthomonadaceae bacterium]|nr:ABC transporter ATP-binding protein [Xanthomonadaceae bacterium]